MGSEKTRTVDPEMLANLDLLEDLEVFSAGVGLDFLHDLSMDEDAEVEREEKDATP